ncbi:4-hydroxy-3-methylbut-2-enyl diphosphate reductase [Candidatus Avelusimicrobium alvi]|uniref:4-hydroxy-3-methylbut-2-enyl diphosphate reductase n=1 Tax=Candidatus Avelusimicrobium alvi TaxID=3416221 RepID=UPI003D0BDA5D
MEKEQDVTVAKSAGFCPGVKRAIDKVLELEAAGKKPVYTIGPLIHNKQVTDMLAAKQITSIDRPQDAADKSGVLVIRAHGITPRFQQEVQSCGMEVVDATCPLVKHAQNIIAQYAAQGYHTVIVGDGGHAEVIGLLGYTQGKGVVVSGPEEAARLPHFDKVNVVSQTTQKESVFYETAEEIKKHADECQISNTICQPTKDRQKETIELAKSADLVIVVGGRHSANTARLALLCKGLAPAVLHVETEDELEAAPVTHAKKIFITAGASTPNWVIDRVAARVRELRKPNATSRLSGLAGKIWRFLVRNCFYTAFAASALTYVCMRLEGVPADSRLLAFSWLFVYALTAFNRAAEAEPGQNRRFLTAAAILSGLFATGTALLLNGGALTLCLLFLVAGFAYPFRHLLKLQLLSLPGTKDIVTALGWAFTCALLPAYEHGLLLRKASYLAIFYTILLVFMRSVTLGFTSANKDLIIGRESFYKAFGMKKTKWAVTLILLALTAALATLLTLTWKPALVEMLLIGHLYTVFIVIYYYSKSSTRSVKDETLIDGQFFVLWALSGLAAYL